MLISEHLDKLEMEAQVQGISPDQLRQLVAEFWQIKEKDPESFVELVEVVLC